MDANLFGLMLLRQLRMQRSHITVLRYAPPHLVVVYDDELIDKRSFDTNGEAASQTTPKQLLH